MIKELNMEKEILACIKNDNIKYLHSGQISKYVFPMERKEAHQKKISHLIIRLFIMAFTPENETLFLVQKRSENKESFPGYYTDSASGHVLYDKDLDLNQIKENAIRELNEEFGVPQTAIKYIKFHTLEQESNKLTTEIAYIFFGLIDHDVKLKPNPEELETEDSRFYTKSELIEILNKKKSVDYSKKIWKKLVNSDIKALFEKEQATMPEKSDDIALFIGRFQPLHHGHIYVIYRIMEQHDKLKIGIGSSQISKEKNNPFSMKEREDFLRAALEKRNIKNYEIHGIPDIFNAKKWVDHVVSIVGDFDIVYSNSDWVRTLFQNKGYRVGKKLTIFKNKYNATNVRKLITKENQNWKSLVPNEVVSLINQYDGIERIKSLN
jgi:nicotinamide-nucleotide adenylyltransferase